MKASVITPTYGRQAHVRRLVQYFLAQTYADKELLILDDSPEPDPQLQAAAKADSRIRYWHQAERLSLGAKRNFLIEAAEGEVILQFDDDDYYSPTYMNAMVDALGEDDFVKLSAWYAYSVKHNVLTYWDTADCGAIHFKLSPDGLEAVPGHLLNDAAAFDNNLWGYGFSYVFRKNVYPTVQFPQIGFGEDYDFVQNLHQAGFKLKAFPDTSGLVLHLLHENNMSCIFPQYILPPHLLTKLFGPEVQVYQK